MLLPLFLVYVYEIAASVALPRASTRLFIGTAEWNACFPRPFIRSSRLVMERRKKKVRNAQLLKRKRKRASGKMQEKRAPYLCAESQAR